MSIDAGEDDTSAEDPDFSGAICIVQLYHKQDFQVGIKTFREKRSLLQ